MNQQALEIRRETWCNRFDSKKFFIISCSMGLIFFSLTFMYTFTNPLRSAPLTQHPKRVNIMLMSFPRSGSSFLAKFSITTLVCSTFLSHYILCKKCSLDIPYSSLISPLHLIKTECSKFLRILTTASLLVTCLLVTSTGKIYAAAWH